MYILYVKNPCHTEKFLINVLIEFFIVCFQVGLLSLHEIKFLSSLSAKFCQIR